YEEHALVRGTRVDHHLVQVTRQVACPLQVERCRPSHQCSEQCHEYDACHRCRQQFIRHVGEYKVLLHIETDKLSRRHADQEWQNSDDRYNHMTGNPCIQCCLLVLCRKYALPRRLPHQIERSDGQSIEQRIPYPFRTHRTQVFKRCIRNQFT